jgi:cytochrome b561
LDVRFGFSSPLARIQFKYGATVSNHELTSVDTTAGWRYGMPAVFLHWLMAVLIVGLVAVGWYMMSIEDEPGSNWYFSVHKSFGIVLFGLVLMRII